jgi:hypothetical protein
MTFLLFLYKENVIKNTNDGGTINFTGLSLTINLTGLSSPIIVHITPAININADIMDRAKNKFYFILVFFKLSIFITLLNYCFYLILTSLQVHNSSALRLMRLAL